MIRRAPRRQRAQAMVEFIYAFPVMVLLVFGGMQMALMYVAKTTLNYAVFEAARQGAVSNASFDAVTAGFARGMAPLYTSISEDDASGFFNAPDRLLAVQNARDRVLEEIDDEFVCIERINPDEDAFTAYAITNDDGDDEIPNDNLIYRSSTTDSPASVSIQDANLLKIRVTYCYRMIIPFVNRTIATLLLANGPGDFREACLTDAPSPRIPITAQTTIRMQSAAVYDGGFAADCS